MVDQKECRDRNKTYSLPEHDPGEPLPLMTSQYAPSGTEVVKLVVQSESPLLIATKAAEPIVY